MKFEDMSAGMSAGRPIELEEIPEPDWPRGRAPWLNAPLWRARFLMGLVYEDKGELVASMGPAETPAWAMEWVRACLWGAPRGFAFVAEWAHEPLTGPPSLPARSLLGVRFYVLAGDELSRAVAHVRAANDVDALAAAGVEAFALEEVELLELAPAGGAK